jgi:hypothetical protein
MQALDHEHEDAATCPFCGQALLDREALNRVRRSEREAAQKLEAEAKTKGEQIAKVLVTKAEAENAKKIKALERDVAARNTEVSKLKRQHEQEVRKARADGVAQTKVEAKREAEEKVSREMLRYQRLASQEREEKEAALRRIERLTAEERGEFNEQQLILLLKEAFPDDKIERVKRAHTGADLIQDVMVRTADGLVPAGRVIYECKDTLHWNNTFIEQTKRAGQTHRTPYLIIISRAFPRNEKTLCVRDGVVIVHPSRVVDLAKIMRRMVEEVNRASLTAEGEVAKSEELYQYLSSTEFRQVFDSIGECADHLTELLTKERKWHENTWVKRQTAYNELTSKTSAIDARVRTIIEKPKSLTGDLDKVVQLRSTES